MSLYSWLVNKLRFRRFSMSARTRLLTFGAIYTTTYTNWRHDPRPMIWVQYSGPKYTHAINIHYLNSYDKAWFANTIYIIKKAGQVIDGRLFYSFLKMRRPNIVRVAYRVYFTGLLNARLVSAGITPLDKMVYTGFRDPWIAFLNQKIQPSEMRQPPVIAYHTEELRDRIIEAQNAVDIRKQRVGAYGTAPWMRK